MWYFAWILGLSAACFFSVLNALWFEIKPERIGVEPMEDSTDHR